MLLHRSGHTFLFRLRWLLLLFGCRFLLFLTVFSLTLCDVFILLPNGSERLFPLSLSFTLLEFDLLDGFHDLSRRNVIVVLLLSSFFVRVVVAAKRLEVDVALLVVTALGHLLRFRLGYQR